MFPFSSEEEPLLTGTDDAVSEFVDADRCIVIDWRDTEEDTVWNVQQWLPEGTFDFQVASEGNEGYTVITVRFRDREDTFTLLPRSQNNFRTLLWVEQILLPDYEIKLFRCTEGDDTHGFLLRSTEWWAAFRKEFPTRYTETFSDLETLNTLWKLDALPKPSPAIASEPPSKPWWKWW
jgi:hypothetical protein